MTLDAVRPRRRFAANSSAVRTSICWALSALGRMFSRDDVAEPSGQPVAVISDGF
jgi:hypothetical protein